MSQDLYEHIGWNSKRIAHLLTNLHNKKLEKHGVTIAQYRALYFLKETNGLSQSQLLDKLKVKPSTLTGIIEQLETKKFVYRKSCDKDARIKNLFLTPLGTNKIESLWNVLFNMEEQLTKGFTPEEKALMLSWQRKLIHNLLEEAET
ncbi:MarR family winged helix-turn-helix transcriptional regulator [Longirhabdus pacifica]|uniref:MarR family winged helix-turn-helix transcriptional regulator n=1 Tax=Longirhabdus pacifica TaxID=2305227 RepID=UPI0010088A08|nr:MarR family transcriptional regulator [Longirhabdus pacifica]